MWHGVIRHKNRREECNYGVATWRVRFSRYYASGEKILAHREGRTRSLQITRSVCFHARYKSLTLYPIELGGRYNRLGSNIYVLNLLNQTLSRRSPSVCITAVDMTTRHRFSTVMCRQCGLADSWR